MCRKCTSDYFAGRPVIRRAIESGHGAHAWGERIRRHYSLLRVHRVIAGADTKAWNADARGGQPPIHADRSIGRTKSVLTEVVPLFQTADGRRPARNGAIRVSQRLS